MSHSETYQCPACGQKVTVHVPLTTNPTCSNHTGGGRVMKLIETNHKENPK